ncbi:MAG TPA: DUF1127 domain-containing protein [Azospirillaceae bacterium]|nr:DUF1127 domain-containing protein [Azospirillaceae bacterium]
MAMTFEGAAGRPTLSIDLRGSLARLVRGLVVRAHSPRRLSDLNEHLLRDLGLTRADASTVSNKPFGR